MSDTPLSSRENDEEVPKDAGQPLCPCGEVLLFEIYPGYEFNEWRSWCPKHGLIDVDAATVVASGQGQRD